MTSTSTARPAQAAGGPLARIRREAGYPSARALAAELGISESTYSRYESAPGRMPLPAALRIADALGCPLDDIVGRRPPALPCSTRRAVDAAASRLVDALADLLAELDRLTGCEPALERRR